MLDLWQVLNPNVPKVFTCYSSCHISYSCIDYIFISLTLSDHAPVQSSLFFTSPQASTKIWRFNVTLLQDAEFIRILADGLNEFITWNLSTDIDP